MKNKKLTTYQMAVTALMAAALCVLGPLSVPIGAIPISLSNFVICLTAWLLGPKFGTLSVAVYLLIGLVGVPVFSGYGAGIAKLAGPTGGYLVGYLLLAFIGGLFIEKSKGQPVISGIGLVLGDAACYVLGTAWFVFQMQCELGYALSVCVYPFIALDLAKIVVSCIVGALLRKRLVQAGVLKLKEANRQSKRETANAASLFICDPLFYIAKGRSHHGLDGVHPVLGFVEHDALGAFKHFIGHFHGIATKALAHLLAHGGLVVVEGGQAVHEHSVRACNVHQLLVDLVGGKVVDALSPHLHRLTHGHPHIGVQHVGTLGGLGGILLKGEGGTGLGSDLLALGHEGSVRLVLLGCTGGEVQAHLGAATIRLLPML